MATDEKTTVTDVEVAKAIIAHEGVKCFTAKIDPKKLAQPKKLTSCIGGAFWGKAGETWPVSADEEPLIPWLQIVCTEMQDLYGPFYRKQAVCFYIREDFEDVTASSAFDNNDFVVREYTLDEKLIPLKRPKELKRQNFHQVTWTSTMDHPALSKYYGLFSKDVYKAFCDTKDLGPRNRSGIKIGGWPTPVQRDQQYPGSYALQIDMTENYMYGDSGIGYLNKRCDKWSVMFECC